MRYRFHEFLLDTECFELQSNGQQLHLEPQVIELLALLVENRHRLVTKDDILKAIWAGKVVSEAALSSRVKTLRQVLGDSGRQQRFIRTIHGKGFRFITPVTEIDQSGPEPPPTEIKVAEKPHFQPSIVVIPFDNLSNEPDQEYFSDGISSDIIMLLSKHRWLNICARNTSFAYKDRPMDIARLGRELGVDYAIEGSVQIVAGKVRITVQLIDVAGGASKWSDRFERPLTDLFSLQDEITTRIVGRLEPEIGYAERRRVIQGRTTDLQAWDCFHLGIFHFFKFTAVDNEQAQQRFRQCTELDAQFGDAYAWWAYAVVLGMVYWSTKPDQALLRRALDACNKALSIDAQNATYYALRGRVQLARREYHSAIQDNQVAIDLNPSFAAAYCGLGDSLAYDGHYTEAIEYFEQAVALSPHDPQAWAFLTYCALAYIFMEDYEKALELTQQALNIPNCQYWTLAHQVVIFAYLAQEQSMRDALNRLLKVKPDFTLEFAREKLFYLSIESQKEHYLKGLKAAGVPD